MSVVIEVPIKFIDQEEPTIYRDANVLKRCPLIVRALEGKHPDWETAGVKLEEPLVIDFNKAAGDFCFTYANRYVAPDQLDEYPKLEDYPEANEKTLEELKDIIEAAVFLDCFSLMHCIGFVIAQKLNQKTPQELARFLGVDHVPEEDGDDGWITP